MKNYDLEADIEKQFPAVWRKVLSENSATSQDHPVGILLGGQPGAGKSYGIKRIKQRLNNNVLVINGDEFRAYHKHYNDYYQLYGKEASKYTGEFAGKMVAKVRDEAIRNRFNIVIEGTFRTINVPLKELNNLKDNGYKSEIIICTCPKKLSWESTITRAKELEKAGLQPRYVPKEHHNLVTEVLAKNVKAIFDTGLASNLEIYSREKQLFNSKKDNPEKIMQVINDELNGINQKKNLSKMLSEHLNTASKKLNDGKKHSLNNNIKMKI